MTSVFSFQNSISLCFAELPRLVGAQYATESVEK